jgi:hypothetical protein
MGSAKAGRTRPKAAVATLAIVALVGCTPTVRAPESSPPSASPGSTPTRAASSPAPTVAPSRTPRTNPGISAAALGCEVRKEPRSTSAPPPLGQAAPIPQPRIDDPDAAAGRAIRQAIDALDKLGSYRFSTSVTGRNFFDISQATTFDFGMQAKLTQRGRLALDGILGSRIREPDGSAATSGGWQVLMGDGWAWGMDNVSGVLEPISLERFGPLLDLAPAPMLRRHVLPFAAGFRPVGDERHAGIATTHYRATQATAAEYATLAKLGGKLRADVWIAKAGGWLAGATITGTAPAPGNPKFTDILDLRVAVEHVDDPADVIKLPAAPVPDPIRPVGPEVHLRLSFRSEVPHGQRPDAKEIDQMGVTLRVRLDVYDRQVDVETLPDGRIVATICFTTEPEEDQRLAQMTGALTVVPLPPGPYGTAAHSGPTALPAPGERIDPSLEPIAPAGEAHTVSHVDPVTGRRGVAFRLDNKAGDVYREWAKAHADEYVALVFDGVVLGTQAVRDQVADGSFAFTGDYTRAEAERLRDQLRQPPLAYPLVLVDAIEVPV